MEGNWRLLCGGRRCWTAKHDIGALHVRNRDAGSVAVRVVPLTYFVGTALPSTRTAEVLRKPVPVKVIVLSGSPSFAVAGVILSRLSGAAVTVMVADTGTV